MMERIEKDRLNDWFARLPDKKLPADFQTLLMERIRQEALLRAERRKERLNLLGMGVLIISLLGGLAVLFFFHGNGRSGGYRSPRCLLSCFTHISEH